jgi:uncharacterized protein YjbI with pentapeptide repeats
LNSDWLSDRIVKIQAYEESNIVWYDETSNPVDYKMYKFYVTDTNWRRLREFQNFYIDGIGINIPSDELLRFFDDKFSLGHWFQTYDIIGSKPERRVLIQLSTKEENRNSPGEIISLDNDLQPNFDNPLPSVDVFISGGDDFNFGASTSYPRPFIGQTIDIERGYIIDSDFISGLFKDSRWISGNYFNYNQDVSFSSGSGYTASVTASTAELELNIGGDWRPNIIGTTSDVSNIAFVNGLWYDSNLNGGSNLVKLPDVYKVNSIVGTNSRQIVLQDILTQSVLNTFGDFTDQSYLITPNASNQWNYIHPVKFENSIIYSGVFRRAYFEGCLFENFEFDVTDKDLEDVTNKRKLLVSDVIFDGDNNEIRNGLFQYSHMIAGNDNWKGGIFHRGVWNTQPFTYSFSPTSSFTYQNNHTAFKNGILRNTTWENGIFENGTFYKNKSNVTGTNSVFSDSRRVYYYEGFDTRWTWKMGDFINGDFERSNFEMGNFLDGNFYDSDFFIGEATGGNFGKSNIPFEKTRIWEGTFSNVNVINANFRSGDVEDSTNTSNSSLIYWNSGIFRSGVFGTIDDVNYDPTGVNNNRAIWVDGTFKGGDFKDSAEWKGGQFDGGRFLSYYWYEPSNPRTPFELNTFTSASFSWQGGKFNGGQFGTGETSSNSTWFTGEFNGGLFQGRYWKDGIFTRGDFEGHAASYSTDIDNYNSFINSFNTYYYGYWQDGFVSKVKDKFVKNQKIFTEVERVSTKKKKNPLINFKNMFWNFGTFSSFDGSMDNSVWFNGTFQDGYFENSVFNPYVNLALPLFVDGTFSNGWVNSGASASSNGNNLIIENYSSLSSTLTLPYSVFENQVYTIQLEVVSNTNMQLDVEGVNIVSSGITGIITGTFSADDEDLVLEFITGGGVIEFTDLIVYPGTQSGFRIGDSCIWENGEAYSSDFYFSKWKQGIFDSFADSLQGNAWGLIWQNGIVKYMNAYNVFWENGIWKNGNWFGSPFTKTFGNNEGCQEIVLDSDLNDPNSWNISYFDISGNGGDATISSGEFSYYEGPKTDTGGIPISCVSSTFPTIIVCGENLATLQQTGILTPGNQYTVTIEVTENKCASVRVFGVTDIDIVDSFIGCAGTGTFQATFTASGTNLDFEITSSGDDLGANGWNFKMSSISIIECSSNDPVIVYPGFSEDILNNIADYASFSQLNSWDSIHMNDTFTGSIGNELLADPSFEDPSGSGWDSTNWTSLGNIILSSIDNSEVELIGLGNTDEIFIDILQTYVIEVEYGAYYSNNTIPTIPNPELKVRFEVGYIGGVNNHEQEGTFISQNGGIRRNINESIVVYSQNSGGYVGSLTNTITFNYTPTNLDSPNSRKLKIERLFHTGESSGMLLYIISASVRKLNYQYDPNTNNLLNLIPSWNPQIGATISLPTTIYQLGSTNPLRARFGNGNFRSGIWENGVWNEGWRDDETVIWASDIDKFNGGKNKAYRELTKWTFTLDIIPTSGTSEQSPNSFDNFNIGDKVSIGNIVMKDINGNRRLIKDYLTIVDKFSGLRQNPISLNSQINSRLITVEFETTFPIFTIERDSDEHLIHISKNVWLNGVFLNGKFLNGVWNNGLMRGFPYITQMVDTQWIDGTFKGGRFIGLTSSYEDNYGNSLEYHKGLIQKFRYYDENVSGIPFRFKFNSFIDVNYFETSGVNINRLNETFVQTPAGFTTSYIDNNHYGYPTKDVLESVSTLRNGFDLISRDYKLGWKWKEYQEWIPQQEIQFNGVNQFGWTNSTSSDEIVYLDNGYGYGLSNLNQFGWTFGYGSQDIFADSVQTSIVNNYGSLPIELQNKLIFSGGKPTPAISGNGLDNYSLDFIDNEEVDIERLRYSYVEITGENLSPRNVGSELNPIVFFNNYPASYSVAAKTFYYGNTQSTITIPVNQFATSSVTDQREYFFNKKGLEMTLLGGANAVSGTFSLAFEKIRMVETDMIPFLNFVGGCVNITTDGEEEIVEPSLPEWEEEGITISFKSDSTLLSSGFGDFFGPEQVQSLVTDPPNPRMSYRLPDCGSGNIEYFWCKDGTWVEERVPYNGPLLQAFLSSRNTGYLIPGEYDLPGEGTLGYLRCSGSNPNNPTLPAAQIIPYCWQDEDPNPLFSDYCIPYGGDNVGEEVPIGQPCEGGDPCLDFTFYLENSASIENVDFTQVGDVLYVGGGFCDPNLNQDCSEITGVWTLPDGTTETTTAPSYISGGTYSYGILTTQAGDYTLTLTRSDGCSYSVIAPVSPDIVECDERNLQMTMTRINDELVVVITVDGVIVPPGPGSGLTINWYRYEGNTISGNPQWQALNQTDALYFTYPWTNTPNTSNSHIIEEGKTYVARVTYDDCPLDASFYNEPETPPVDISGEGLVAKLFMRFAGYTQSYTYYPGDGTTPTTVQNPTDPLSGEPYYLPYYENTDWGYTLQIIYAPAAAPDVVNQARWVFRHLPFNHPVDPNSSLGDITNFANRTKIIAKGPQDINAMINGITDEGDWQINEGNDGYIPSWNGTLDDDINILDYGYDIDRCLKVFGTEPGKTTVSPLKIGWRRTGIELPGPYDTQWLPLYLEDTDTEPVAYRGFRRRDQNNDGNIAPPQVDNRVVYNPNPTSVQTKRYDANYTDWTRNTLIAVWLENAINYNETQQWAIILPFDNFMEVPQNNSNPSNYNLLRDSTDWEELEVGESGVGTQTTGDWENFNVQPIDFVPSSEEENPTVVDTTIFAGDGDLICFDYLNHDIQIPYIAKSPDIDSDILNNYVGSVNIWIPDVNINTVEANDIDVNTLYPNAERGIGGISL